MLDDPYYDVRRAVVDRISRDRVAAGLSPVELDEFSSRVADRHCQEMAGHRYLSHWNLRGLLPYQRYHLAGGRDHIQENLSRMTVVSTNRFPIGTQPAEVLPHLLRAHERFLEETPPWDGHRKNILDPVHTHVGIGLAVVGGEFTMAQQFVNRYAQLDRLPEALPGGSIHVAGEILRKDYGPYYCVLFYEGRPRPRAVPELEETYAYTDMDGETCGTVPPWEMVFDGSRGRFRFSLRARNCGPGFYHLVLWVRREIRSIPYQLYPGGSFRIDTKGAVPTAGWIFQQA